MLLRGVLILLAVAIVVWLLSARSRAPKSPRSMRRPEAFVRCAHCGVHLPRNDAVIDRGFAYCSQAHRLAGPRQRGGS
ncbi:MAG TPA: PP0621 family protein [Burkholderiaceae bacterium]|nr:PP0621 family protein [Burkholderiaceae bacterium]